MIEKSKAIFLKKRLPLLALLLLSASITFVAFAAITRFSSIDNEFVVGAISPVIHEDFDTNTKEDVYVQNEGDSPIYVRVAIVYNFVDQNGVTLFEAPVSGSDYTTTLSNSSNWIASSDGYFYYKTILEPNMSTDVLIDRVQDLTSGNGKILNVNIIAQGIQAYPDDAVRESWNVNINDGILSLRNQ